MAFAVLFSIYAAIFGFLLKAVIFILVVIFRAVMFVLSIMMLGVFQLLRWIFRVARRKIVASVRYKNAPDSL